MIRRLDLYSLDELTRRCVGECHRRYVQWLYKRRGALVTLNPTVPVERVSYQYSVKAPQKHDVNLVEIMEVCFDYHGIAKKWRDQFRGTCVGQGGATGSDMGMSVAWLLFDKEFPGRVSVATTYAGSRVEVAGKPGHWDGSNGSWVAEFLTRWGVATLGELGLESHELVEDERLALLWCADRYGVPGKFELIARERPFSSAPLVLAAEELIACMESGNPVLDASNLIPANRDTDDVVPLSGRGGHLTVFGGIRWRKGEPEILYVNSWGRGWGRNGCVWISMRDALRILAQGDSYALIGINGLDPAIPLKL